jgi:CheY-like chemotaxis protein
MKILIVDDIFTNRLLLTEVIRNIGHEYVQAKNGKEAIEALLRENFDLILMDIEMPVMNGLETTKFIKENFDPPKNKIPIIALTAHNPQLFFEDFQDVGFDELLTKPYSIEKIAGIIQKLPVI